MRNITHPFNTFLLSVLLVAALELPSPSKTIAQDEPVAPAPAEIGALINQLGAPEYARRERAQKEIRKLGQVAFDALFAAQNHDDLEVQLSAKRLLDDINIRWLDENSSDEAQAIMNEFDSRLSTDKRNRIMRLNTLDTEEAATILTRIVRYDLDEKISKRAALSLLQMDDDPQQRDQTVKIAEQTLSNSPRKAASWVLAWVAARTAGNDGEAEANWSQVQSFVEAELDLLKLRPGSNQTDVRLVHDLMIWQANNILQRGHRDKAFTLYRELLVLMNGSRGELFESVDWLAKHGGWPLIIETQQRFPATFAESSLLLYHVALAYRELGDEEKVDEFVSAALNVEVEGGDRRSTAFALQERGLTEWAEGEYRAAIDSMELVDYINVSSRSLLAEMLFDMGDAKRAAEVMKPTVDALLKDDEVSDQIKRNYPYPTDALISRRYYFLAKMHLRNGDYDQAEANLDAGIGHEPTDADILIARYKLTKRDKVKHEKTLQLLKAATGKFRDDIRQWQQALIESSGDGDSSVERRQLAIANNQFAWLVCNTTGDFKEAIRCSHRSLELRPETSSYLDTLAHCYYAVDDFKNAVKYQAQAVELDPFENILQKKLKLFREALKQGQKIPEND